MIHRIPSVMGILLASMFAQSVWTDRIAHAQDQPSPTLPNSDAKLQADIVFWQSIVDSEDPRDFRDYLEQFPDGQFVTLAHRRVAHAEVVAARGRVLLNAWGLQAVSPAARNNDIEVLEWLAAQGADINGSNDVGEAPMHVAASGNAVDAMEWLYAQGADINARSHDNVTPVFSAAQGNAVDAMEWLYAQGADINARNEWGETPMHHAASNNAVDAMRWLVARGADINARDEYRNTPLNDAASANAVAAINWLKVNGARDDGLMFQYTTTLSPRDTYNSRGASLNDVCAIVQQDRANVHRFGNPDGETPDSFFTSTERRALIAGKCDYDRNLYTVDGIRNQYRADVLVRVYGRDNSISRVLILPFAG